MRNSSFWLTAFGFATALTLSACNGSGSDTGSMSLAVTDAPIDNATQVVVQFDGVELKPADGKIESFDFSEPKQIDLLAQQGGNSATLLDGVEVPAGDYNWIRLKITAESGKTDSYIKFADGATYPLYIPSGAQTGLKLVSGFTVPAGGSADFTIDFDLRKSVHLPGSSGADYMLKPALRLVDNVEVGSISGTVSNSLATQQGCTPAVYVYSGADATPGDVNDSDTGTQPITTAQVTMDDATGNYTYKAGFLTAGDYTAAFTCDAGQDDPSTVDTLNFTGTTNATVTANETTTVDFN